MKASKFKRSFLLLFTVSLIFAALTIPCSAEESGFTFDDISDNEIDKIWERIELKPIEDPEITKGFCCFSVNDQGNYALGFDGFLKSTEEKKY